jgi:hypothetical protein
MFDDLASPERSEPIDAPPVATHAHDLAEPAPRFEPPSAEVPMPAHDSTEPTSSAPALSPADIDAIARAVVARLSDRILREIAWDVVPDLAEIIVRERIHELERDEREPS